MPHKHTIFQLKMICSSIQVPSNLLHTHARARTCYAIIIFDDRTRWFCTHHVVAVLAVCSFISFFLLGPEQSRFKMYLLFSSSLWPVRVSDRRAVFKMYSKRATANWYTERNLNLRERVVWSSGSCTKAICISGDLIFAHFLCLLVLCLFSYHLSLSPP